MGFIIRKYIMQKNPVVKVALVTGAARRIGAEIARTLHHAGLNIVLHYHSSGEEAKLLCEQFNQVREHSAVAIRAELQEVDSINALMAQAGKAWGRLDVLVNNASRFYKTPVGKITEFAWDDLMNSNLKAPFFLSQAAAPLLADAQGCIINITDIHADTPLRDYSIYCISKSGLVMMTKVLAKELGPRVRVNAIAPGSVMWPEGENTLSEENKLKIVRGTALHRLGHPEDIARAVLFFVCDADYITGQVLVVDGGRTL